MRKSVSWILVGSAAFVGGTVSLVLLVQRLTERGLEADANGTVGYTATGDVIQGGVGVALILLGLVVLVFGLVRARATPPIAT